MTELANTCLTHLMTCCCPDLLLLPVTYEVNTLLPCRSHYSVLESTVNLRYPLSHATYLYDVQMHLAMIQDAVVLSSHRELSQVPTSLF